MDGIVVASTALAMRELCRAVKIKIDFTCLVLAYHGCLGKQAIKRVFNSNSAHNCTEATAVALSKFFSI